MEVPETDIPGKEVPQEWIMYFDGAFSLQGAGASMLLATPSEEHLKYVIQMHLLGKRQPTIQQNMKGSLSGSGLLQNWELRS